MHSDSTPAKRAPGAGNHNYPPDHDLVELMVQLGSYTKVAKACGVRRESLRDYLKRRPVLREQMADAGSAPGPNRPKYATEEERHEAIIQNKRRYFESLKRTNPEKYRKWARDSAKRKSPEQRAKWNHYNRLRLKKLGLRTAPSQLKELPRHIWADPCSYCSGAGGTADHIVPLQHGGELGEENLAGACLSCNASKGEKSLLTFLLRRRS